MTGRDTLSSTVQDDSSAGNVDGYAATVWGRDLRLLPLAAVVWSSALFCAMQPSLAWGWAIGSAAAAVALLGVLAWRQRSRAAGGGGLLVVMLVAGAASGAAVGFAQPARQEMAAYDERIVEIVGQVSSSAAIGRDGRLWFDADSARAGPPAASKPLGAPVRIGVEPREGLDLGAAVTVRGEAKLADPGERAVLVVFANAVTIDAPPPGVFGIGAGIRRDFMERSSALPEPGAGLLPGLAVGDTRAVSTELNEAMRTSGLSHLTAVSGANCAIVVGAVFWLTALAGGSRTLRVALALTALAAFVVLVTPEPSVIRAAVMAALAMLTVLLGNPRSGISVLASAVTCILISDPWLAATPGFALSAAASAALILLAPALTRSLGRWVPNPLALAIAVPLAAQLACGPIIALFAEQQSLVGVVANLLAAPAAPLATVMGLLSCLAGPAPPLADFLAASAWLPSAWIAATATTTAALPAAQLLIVPGVGSALLVAVLSAALGLLLIRPRRATALVRASRRAAAIVVSAAVALGGAHVLLSGPLATLTIPEDWTIAACDVGQGDALVVRSRGEVALIDTGPDPDPVDGCLRSLGVTRVDLLVLTHFDLDHVGGVEAVVGRVGTVLHGPVGETADDRMLSDLAAGGATLVAAAAGLRGDLGAASWQVLWPRRNSAAFPPENDASVVVEFGGGEVPRSLFLGDLAAVPQRLLLAGGGLRDSYAVVKVAHHGSADQDPGLYSALHPSAAIFSAGVDNDYGHPREEALAMLDASGAHILRTDLQGRILLGIRDGELAVWTERSDPGAAGVRPSTPPASRGGPG